MCQEKDQQKVKRSREEEDRLGNAGESKEEEKKQRMGDGAEARRREEEDGETKTCNGEGDIRGFSQGGEERHTHKGLCGREKETGRGRGKETCVLLGR